MFKDILITINRSKIDISTFLKAQIFDSCVFSYCVMAYLYINRSKLITLFFVGVSHLSAHPAPLASSQSATVPSEFCSMKNGAAQAFFQHRILCNQEIRKRRWSSPERTILLWASVPELQSPREPHNTQSGGKLFSSTQQWSWNKPLTVKVVAQLIWNPWQQRHNRASFRFTYDFFTANE